MEEIYKFVTELMKTPEFGYICLGIVIGILIMRFILRNIFKILIGFFISLAIGAGVLTYSLKDSGKNEVSKEETMMVDKEEKTNGAKNINIKKILEFLNF